MQDQAGLVAALIDGKNDAFEELILRFGPRLLLKAEQMLGSKEDAQECVQECYIQVHRNISSFRGDASIFSWMYQILVNACLRKMRSRATTSMVSVDSLMPEFDDDGCRLEPMWQTLPTAEEILDQNRTRRQVLDGIRSLPDTYRDVLYLRDIEGYSTAEVSEFLSLSESATKVRLHRARAVLKKILEPSFLERQVS